MPLSLPLNKPVSYGGTDDFCEEFGRKLSTRREVEVHVHMQDQKQLLGPIMLECLMRHRTPSFLVASEAVYAARIGTSDEYWNLPILEMFAVDLRDCTYTISFESAERGYWDCFEKIMCPYRLGTSEITGDEKILVVLRGGFPCIVYVAQARLNL